MARYFNCTDSLIHYFKLKSEGENLAQTCSRKMYWANDALKKKDATQLKRYWDETHAATAPLLAADKYHQFPEVTKYLQEYNQLADVVEKSIRQFQVSDEIKSKSSSLTSKAYWVKSSLDKKDANNSSRYGEELRTMFTPFVAAYGSEEEAQKIIEEMTSLLDRVDKEVGGIALGKTQNVVTQTHIFLESEAKDLISRLDSKSYWVVQSLDRKDVDGAVRYANELREMFQPMLNKYSSLEVAKACITKMQGILNRVDKEVAPMKLGI